MTNRTSRHGRYRPQSHRARRLSLANKNPCCVSALQPTYCGSRTESGSAPTHSHRAATVADQKRSVGLPCALTRASKQFVPNWLCRHTIRNRGERAHSCALDASRRSPPSDRRGVAERLPSASYARAIVRRALRRDGYQTSR
jgi:hypothetical protein